MTILVVEDDPTLRDGLVELLRTAGHVPVAVGTGRAALARTADPAIDLVLLDLTLPGLDGLAVCRLARELRPALPILVLTARGAEDDKVEGLRAGADDYVTKPFGTRELLARIEALGRRSRTPSDMPQIIEHDGCAIDLGRSTARRLAATIPLTAREVALLRWLYQHRSRAVTRSELLVHVWGAAADIETRTVDMTVANLRHKIERDPKDPRIVVTIKGAGYAWGAP